MTDLVLYRSPCSGSGRVSGLLGDLPRTSGCDERLKGTIPAA